MDPLARELDPPSKPSTDEAPNLELKILLALRYPYLGTNETLPIRISVEFSNEQVEALLRILKRLKKAIGRQMADINGISPTLCMHIIYMKEDHKPDAQHQHRLNPVMKEVVRKEVIKVVRCQNCIPHL